MILQYVSFKSESFSTIISGFEKKYTGNNYRKFRSFLDSRGLRWIGSTGMEKRIQIRIFDGNEPTMFAHLIVKRALSPITIVEDGNFPKITKLLTPSKHMYVDGVSKAWLKDGTYFYSIPMRIGTEEDQGFVTEFQDIVNGWDASDQVQTKAFAKLLKLFQALMNQAVILFEDKERNVSKKKQNFGIEVTSTLKSLGAHPDEISAYWNNIRDKRFVTPLDFMGYLRYMDEMMKDHRSEIEAASKSLTREELDAIGEFGFLPKDFNVSIGILKSYLETR